MQSWDKLSLPKDPSGLGLRKTRDMNKAMLAKTSLTEQDSIWGRIMKTKYNLWWPLQNIDGGQK